MRVAVVGTSSVATDNYLPYLAALDGVTLGLSNRSRARAATAAGRFGGEVLNDPADVAAWHPDVAFVLR